MKQMDGEEIRRVAEQAAEWLELLSTAARDEKERFWAWLKMSPLHVREFLIAAVIADELRDLDWAHWIDVEEIVAKAYPEVISAQEQLRAE